MSNLLSCISSPPFLQNTVENFKCWIFFLQGGHRDCAQARTDVGAREWEVFPHWCFCAHFFALEFFFGCQPMSLSQPLRQVKSTLFRITMAYHCHLLLSALLDIILCIVTSTHSSLQVCRTLLDCLIDLYHLLCRLQTCDWLFALFFQLDCVLCLSSLSACWLLNISEGSTFYCGWDGLWWNSPGSFTVMHSPFSTSLHLTLIPYSPPIQLFGALAAMKEYVLSIKDSSKVTWTQLLCWLQVLSCQSSGNPALSHHILDEFL